MTLQDDADDGPASPSAVRPMSTSPGPATPAASTAADMAKPSSASKKRRGAELGQADGELEPKRPKKLKAKQKLARAARGILDLGLILMLNTLAQFRRHTVPHTSRDIVPLVSTFDAC